jgi:hypothetical protein
MRQRNCITLFPRPYQSVPSDDGAMIPPMIGSPREIGLSGSPRKIAGSLRSGAAQMDRAVRDNRSIDREHARVQRVHERVSDIRLGSLAT